VSMQESDHTPRHGTVRDATGASVTYAGMPTTVVARDHEFPLTAECLLHSELIALSDLDSHWRPSSHGSWRSSPGECPRDGNSS
jgi:hypothetical protein